MRRLFMFGRDARGTSILEFALLLPVLVFILAGIVEFGQTLMVSRKLNIIMTSVADLVAQESTISSSDVTKILTGASTIILPYDSSNLKILVADVNVTSTTQLVAWSGAYNDTALATGAASPTTIPSAIAETGVQMVVVRVKYSFTTPFSSFLSSVTGHSSWTFERYFYERPRQGDSITYS